MYDLNIELPTQPIPLLNRDGAQIATLHDTRVEDVAAAIKAKRAEGWQFLRTVRDAFKPGVVTLAFKRAA